jgi:hypothetical protein
VLDLHQARAAGLGQVARYDEDAEVVALRYRPDETKHLDLKTADMAGATCGCLLSEDSAKRLE